MSNKQKTLAVIVADLETKDAGSTSATRVSSLAVDARKAIHALAYLALQTRQARWTSDPRSAPQSVRSRRSDVTALSFLRVLAIHSPLSWRPELPLSAGRARGPLRSGGPGSSVDARVARRAREAGTAVRSFLSRRTCTKTGWWQSCPISSADLI